MDEFSNVINLEYRVNKSFEGRYFMGHTPALLLPFRTGGWAALFNPRGSGVNVYVNTITVSNYCAVPFRATVWLNAMPDGGQAVTTTASVNATIQPPIWPAAAIVFGAGQPQVGQSLFTRVAGAQTTEVGNYYGKIILPPGGSVLVQLPGLVQGAQAEVAFGWWEEDIAEGKTK